MFPLFFLSIFIEKGYWKYGMRFQQRPLRFGNFTVTLANFIAFLIFTITGVVFLILAMTNQIQMGENAVQFGIAFKSWINAITKPLRAIPYGEYLFGIALIAPLGYFIRSALRKKDETHDENGRNVK